MTKLHKADEMDFNIFADRFGQEAVGLVYYGDGLGKGGRPVSLDEARRYIRGFGETLSAARRTKTNAAYGIFVAVAIAVGFALAGWWTIAWWAVILGPAACFAVFGYASLKPWLYQRTVSDELSRRVVTGILPRSERVTRGYALAWPEAIGFWGLAVPFGVFLMVHSAGLEGLTLLFGEEIGQLYHRIGWMVWYVVGGLFLLYLPYAIYREWQKLRDHL